MVDTGSMSVIDLNADLAEGDRLTERDLGVLDAVTSASLACGFHAGAPAVMRATAAACITRGVVVGAHVSYRDRGGFGRRTVPTSRAALTRDIVDQWTALAEQVAAVGGEIAFVKPHGALYQQMGVDAEVAGAVVDAIVAVGSAALVAQAGTVVATVAGRAGVRLVPEGFPDRAYLADGRLAPRHEPGAVIDDPSETAQRALSLIRHGGTPAVDGAWAAVAAETLCIHGDGERAADSARAVRDALEAAGISVRSFLAAPGRRADDVRGPGS
jgi:5-oxoprolinase (ATP-hydrolysing) subunit A